jgi:hypothetical protein
MDECSERYDSKRKVKDVCFEIGSPPSFDPSNDERYSQGNGTLEG